MASEVDAGVEDGGIDTESWRKRRSWALEEEAVVRRVEDASERGQRPGKNLTAKSRPKSVGSGYGSVVVVVVVVAAAAAAAVEQTAGH